METPPFLSHVRFDVVRCGLNALSVCASETLCLWGFPSPEHLTQTLYSCHPHWTQVSAQMPLSLIGLTKEKTIHCHFSSLSPPSWSLPFCFPSSPIASVCSTDNAIPLIPHLPTMPQYHASSTRIAASQFCCFLL